MLGSYSTCVRTMAHAHATKFYSRNAVLSERGTGGYIQASVKNFCTAQLIVLPYIAFALSRKKECTHVRLLIAQSATHASLPAFSQAQGSIQATGKIFRSMLGSYSTCVRTMAHAHATKFHSHSAVLYERGTGGYIQASVKKIFAQLSS